MRAPEFGGPSSDYFGEPESPERYGSLVRGPDLGVSRCRATSFSSVSQETFQRGGGEASRGLADVSKARSACWKARPLASRHQARKPSARPIFQILSFFIEAGAEHGLAVRIRRGPGPKVFAFDPRGQPPPSIVGHRERQVGAGVFAYWRCRSGSVKSVAAAVRRRRQVAANAFRPSLGVGWSLTVRYREPPRASAMTVL